MTRPKNQRKTNGHAGARDRPNGPAPASTERGGVPVHWDQAASDGASGVPVASAATPAAAGADREAYAEAAPPPPNGEAHDTAGKKPDPKKKQEQTPGGEFPLPANAGEFVEEIHRRTDLFVVWKKLLNSKDPKIMQRAVERLAELRYKTGADDTEEPQQIVIDIDSAVARRAAEGARK